MDINKFWFRLQVLMHMESIQRDGMQLFMFRNLHRIIQVGKELQDHQAWPLPQQCQVHYFTSLSLFSWNSSHLPQCIRNLGIISLSQVNDKLLPTSWTTEGVSLSSWVAGVFGWSFEWLDKPMAGSRKCSWKAQCEECTKAMNTLCNKHWWVSPPFYS